MYDEPVNVDEEALTVEQILAAIDRHTTQSVEVARATLEAAAAQAAIVEEQRKQTRFAEKREALERAQFLKIGEIVTLLAAQQELIQSIHTRLKILEQSSRITLEFIKSAVEGQAKIAPSKAKRLTEQITKRSKESLQNELKIHYHNLDVAKEQAAKHGVVNVPLEKINEISYLEEVIAEIEQELDQEDLIDG